MWLYVFYFGVTYVLYVLFKPTRVAGKIHTVNADEKILEDSTYMNGHVPTVTGYPLKLYKYLTNTLFGRMTLIIKSNYDVVLSLEKFERQICNLRSTFHPVKMPLPGSVQLASPNDPPIDTSHLRNHFAPGSWAPKTIDDYIRAYLGGVVTPVMVAEDIISQIKFVNPEMNIFVDWDQNLIMKQAEESYQRYKCGKPLGPLDGVPIVIKDQLDIKGLTVRCGIEIEGQKCQNDSAVVERLRSQGMLILGLVNMHPLGLNITGINPSKYAGFCPNPFNPDYHPGASSSGTAVALAIGLAPVGIGTDGGGSVRIPAAYCEVQLAAIKPSAGRIPHRGYNGGTNSTIGPMANTMVDCARIYSVISGPDLAEDSVLSWYQPKVSVPSKEKSNLKGVRIGVDKRWNRRASPKILEVFQKSVKKLETEGATIIPIELPDEFNRDTAHTLSFVAEMIPNIQNHLNERTALSDECFVALQSSSEIRSHHYGLAQKIRTKLMNIFDETFEQVDLIVTPTVGIESSKISATDKKFGRLKLKETHLASMFTRVTNFVGIPAISTPMGFDENKMPIGLQFISKWWDEEKLIETGILWERSVQRERPSMYLQSKLL